MIPSITFACCNNGRIRSCLALNVIYTLVFIYSLADYFLVEDPALRFPPQFDLVSSVAPLLFRESNGANIGQLARASMLHAAQLRDIRVALFVVHHSGVCGLLAGALTSAFEVRAFTRTLQSSSHVHS